MEIRFPVLILAKDCGDILKFGSIAEMQRYMERIDVENDEYAAWDANGCALGLVVQEPAWLKVIGAEAKRKGLNKLTMRQIDAEITTARRERRRNTPPNIPAK